MKKIFLLTAGLLLLGTNIIFAQSDDSFNEDALFGSTDDSFSEEALFGSTDDPFSDDALFGSSDDDLFFDDGIIDITETQTGSSDSLNHGELFENGSIKIGGTFTTKISTSTVLYQDQSGVSEENKKSFGDNIADTELTPQAEALLTVDARPSQTLRMYTKFGFAYPFSTTAVSTAKTTSNINPFTNDPIYTTTVNTNVSDYLVLKELFTDFSAADRVFFRFGKHTVTWGTGLFFSPVSDMINTSSIDPENTDAQVDGSLNLRTQITFPGSQNCLWFYVIPSTNFTSGTTTLAKETAVAGKADLVFGGWELGIGGLWKYHDSPKAMITASGSLFGKVSVFGEAVYQYGTASEWKKNTSFDDKSNYFLLTAGASYFWKTPSITLMAQYYYDGYDAKDIPLMNMTVTDLAHNYFTKGHNIAVAANFGRLFGTTDLTATIFGMANFGKEKLPAMLKSMLGAYNVKASDLTTATFSAMLNWTPFKNFTVSGGPYVTFTDWDEKPVVSLKLSATLGGGKF